ncbi:MAG: hypothetical protein EOP10_01625 [Proteobacteria bacterium]|nr:MAG: hypothetical protein EOP10_01625 [Pseudomonadota bacterium]
MYGIVYGHNRDGKLEQVYYFENVTIVGRKISGIEFSSRIVTARVNQWKDLSQINLQSYAGQCMSFPWYDKIFAQETVVELIDFASGEAQLLHLCGLLYQRI